MAESNQELGFDPVELRQKYRAERDRRVRADGNDQYIEVKGDFANYVDDPYVEPPAAREPLTDLVDVLIVGGGFGGLLAVHAWQKRASKTSASSKKAATSAAPGTGIATRVRSVTSRPTSICPC